MKTIRLGLGLASAWMAAGLLSGGAQAATTTFTLTTDGCTGSCGLSPFGTITLTEFGTGTSAYVLVSETLRAGNRYAGTGAGDALEFQIAGTITISNISANFGSAGSRAQGSYSASSFGTFYHAVTCLTCQGGQAGNPAGPLSFEVRSATGVTAASFVTNSSGYYFASDIVGSNGHTGNVGTNLAAVLTATPEPGTVFLMSGAGLLLAFGRKLRKA